MGRTAHQEECHRERPDVELPRRTRRTAEAVGSARPGRAGVPVAGRGGTFNWAIDWFDVVAADKAQGAALVILEDDGRLASVSYDEMRRASNRVARWLAAQGVGKGDAAISTWSATPRTPRSSTRCRATTRGSRSARSTVGSTCQVRRASKAPTSTIPGRRPRTGCSSTSPRGRPASPSSWSTRTSPTRSAT